MANVAEPTDHRHAPLPAVSPVPTCDSFELTFPSPVSISAASPVTAGQSEIDCYPHDRWGRPVDPTDGAATVTYVTRMDRALSVECCGACLLEFMWQRARDGAVRVVPHGPIPTLGIA